MNLNKYSNQIEKIERINNNNFNIFKVLKQQEYENRHSLFLSWLFNTKASHGLGAKFAERFFKECLQNECDIDANKIKLVKTEVRTNGEKEKEEGNHRRRIDILIVGEDFTCTIENKYGSFEHNNQCEIYETYINREYGTYNNKFIYLDIAKPDDFDTNKERYGSFAYISYFEIKDILKEIVDECSQKNDSLEISFIRQYIEVLEEKYQPLSVEITEICAEIDKNEILRITQTSETEFNKLTESEKEFVNIVRKYYRSLKEKNDSSIKRILTSIVKKSEYIHDYRQGYSYAIKIPDKVFSTEKGRCMDTIDCTAIGELKVAIYGGLSGKKSKALLSYIEDDPNFWMKLNKLSKKGWDVKVNYRIGDASNYLNKDGHLIDKIYFDTEKVSSVSIMDPKYVVWRVPQKDTSKDAKEKVKLIRNFVTALEIKGFIDSKRKDSIFQKIDKKCENGISAAWCVELVIPLGFETITPDNETSIADLYREKSIEGLEVLGLGDKFRDVCLLEKEKCRLR